MVVSFSKVSISSLQIKKVLTATSYEVWHFDFKKTLILRKIDEEENIEQWI